MDSREQLINYLKELYQIEKGARDLYTNFLGHLKDEETISAVTKIRNDEERHMKIVEEMIAIVEKK